MSNRRVVGLGLLAGSTVAVAAVAAVVAFGPSVALVPPTPTPWPSLAPPTVPAAPTSSASLPAGSPAPTAPSAGNSAGEGSPLPNASGGAAPPSGLSAASPSLPGAGASPGGSSGLQALFHIGQPAPPLVVPQIGGGQIDLAVLKGHPVWIEFMATWCPSCRDEFPIMNGFAARYASDGLVILAIDVKEDEGAVAAFADSLSVAFPVGVDSSGAAATAWRVAALPVHFFVDSSGVVRDGAIGGIGPDLMAASLRKIMPGVAVAP